MALTPDADAADIASVAPGPDDRLALMLGTEGPGLSAAVLAEADVRARIPLAPGVDSLNVAAAAAIAFYALRTVGRSRASQVALAASASWHHNRGMAFRLVLAAALLALVPVATAAAAEHPQVRFTKAGQAAARGRDHPDDVGRKANWHGGPFTPDPRADDDCADYHPKRSDLVLNGLAGVAYEDSTNGISLRSQTAVFQTAKMVRLFEQRSLLAPKLLQCVAAQTVATLPKTLRFVTIERITFPSVGTFTTAWRITLELIASSQQVAIDQVAFARGRTEINLATTYFVANADTVRPAETRLAQAIAKRIRL